MEILKTKKYLGIAGNALIILGLFLPMISMPSTVSSFMSNIGIPTSFISSGVGILILILSVLSLVIIFSDKIPALSSKLSNQKLTLIPTAISALIIISNIINASSILALGASAGIGLGIGVWIIIIGLVAAIAYPFLYKGEN
ncbi:MAG: hypothetical protein J6N78_00495 [Clostridia bacterium]|nr:hypothetical protein [Clostridia bacterium]